MQPGSRVTVPWTLLGELVGSCLVLGLGLAFLFGPWPERATFGVLFVVTALVGIARTLARTPYAAAVGAEHITFDLVGRRVQAPRRYSSVVVRPWSVVVRVELPDSARDRYTLWGFGMPGRKRLLESLGDAHLVRASR